MRNFRTAYICLLVLMMLFLTACGDSSNSGTVSRSALSTPKAAQIVISSAWTGASPVPTTAIINSLTFTLNLPPGVMASSNGPGGAMFADSGPWGGGTVVGRVIGPVLPPPASAPSTLLYTPATSTKPGTVSFIKGTGLIGVGEFVTIYLEVEAGHSVSSADYSFSEFSAKDASAVAVPVTPALVFSFL